jgi:hypothetical protein
MYSVRSGSRIETLKPRPLDIEPPQRPGVAAPQWRLAKPIASIYDAENIMFHKTLPKSEVAQASNSMRLTSPNTKA